MRALTAAIYRGDRAALAMLYEEWFDRMYAMARAVTRRDESFCLDVVQDAMIRIARSIRPMSTETDLARWLGRIIHTTALDLLRRESRRLARERRAHAAPAPPDAALDAQTAERIAWLRDHIRRLPRDDASLLDARFTRDGSLAAAGAEVSLNAHAAHGRIRRALARLRAAAGETGHD